MSCVMRLTKVEDMLRFQDVCSVYFQPRLDFLMDKGSRGQGVAFYLSTHRWGCTSMIFAFHFYLKSRHYSTSENKGYSQTTSLPFNATFRTQKKLLRIMRFSARLKIANYRVFFGKNRTFFLRNAFLWRKIGISTRFCPIYSQFLPSQFIFLPTRFWKYPTKLHKQAVSSSQTSRRF